MEGFGKAVSGMGPLPHRRPLPLRELEPGLGISRLEAADFSNFLSAAGLFTGFVRIANLNKAAQQQPLPPAAAAAAVASPPANPVGQPEGNADDGAAPPQPSPFACLGATMGWETFRMVHILWLSQLDVPPKSDAKDWALQVRHAYLPAPPRSMTPRASPLHDLRPQSCTRLMAPPLPIA
jgi:hypothetical protein